MTDPTQPQHFNWPSKVLKLYGTMAVAVLVGTGSTSEALAVDGNWIGLTTDWDTPSNWSSGAPPDGTATFLNTGSSTVNVDSFVILSAMEFTASPDAQAHAININDFVAYTGAGIVNNSTNVQTFNVSGNGMIFSNGASASGGSGGVVINNGASLIFQNSSTAGSATINTQNGGATGITETSSGGSARFITNAGGIFDMSQVTSGITAGSIEGDGTYYLGSKQLTTGGNNLTTSVSGIISDGTSGLFGSETGSGGSLVKVGAGTLTLSGANTYTGGTSIQAGELIAAHPTALGPLTTVMQSVGSIFGIDTPTLTIGSLSGAGTLGGVGNDPRELVLGGNNASTLYSGVIQDNVVDASNTPGSSTLALTKTGTGTFVINGANTYSGATTIESGVLNVVNSSALGSTAGGTSVAAGAMLQLEGGVAVGAEALTLNGMGLANSGALRSIFGNNSFGGVITLGSDVQIGVDADSLLLSGGIAGTGLNLAVIGAGELAITGPVATGAGTLSINGTAIPGFGGLTSLAGVNTFTGATTINDGSLQLIGGAAIADTAPVIVNALGTLLVQNSETIGSLAGSGAAMLLNGSTLTTGGANTSTVFSGAIGETAPGGGLTKTGTGLFTLTGTNSYTGVTTVSGGELRIDGSVAGDVTVQGGTTLSGIGTANGAVVVQSGGTLSAGQSPGTFTVGSLDLNAGSTTVFELGAAGIVGGADNDLVVVNGNLTLGGTLDVNAPSAGYYRLFNYGTLTPSNFASITGSTQGTPRVLTNVPNQVNLSIVGLGQQLQFWDGADATGNGTVDGGAGTWNAANTNWTGMPGQADINDVWRSSVGVFAGATGGTVTVVGPQAFDTLQFSTAGYVFDAGAGGQLRLAGAANTGTINTDGGISATINAPIVDGSSTGLVKQGGGTLVLGGVNTYSGGTTLAGGTLAVSADNNLGAASGGLTFDGGTLQVTGAGFSSARNVALSSAGGTLQVDGGALTLTGVISDGGAGGSLTATAGGTVTLTAANFYGGPTYINFGSTLALAGNGTVGNSAVFAGGVFDISQTNSGSTIQGLVDLGTVSLGSRTLTIANGSVFGGVIQDGGIAGGSGGGLTISGGAPQFLLGANTYTGTTTINAGAQLNLSSFGFFNLHGSIANSQQVIADGTFDIAGLTNGGTSIRSLAGAASGVVDLGSNTLMLTNAAGIFAGGINGNGGLTLAGGSQTLSGTNTYTGTTTISAGALAIAAGGSITSNVSNAAMFNNAGTVTGTLGNGGTATNSGSISGTVTNSNRFENLASGLVGGQLTNSAGLATNAGLLNGGVIVTGGKFSQTSGTVSGGFTNNSIANVQGGAVNGAVENSGSFLVGGGAVTSDSTFTNAGGASLGLAAGGNYTIGGLLANAGTISVVSGATLNAAAGLNNAAGGIINVAGGGTLRDDLNNAGTVTNAGAYVANVASNSGSITNTASGIWTGNVLSSTGSIVNNGVWNGSIVSSGTLSGTGSASALSVTGGTFAPGNGTAGSSMTINGNLVLASAAQYLVQVDPTTASFTRATGTATLGGAAVSANFGNGNYISRQYTIVNAAGGVSGTFGGLTNSNLPANFTSSLSYDATNAYLNLTLNFTPPPAPPPPGPVAPIYTPLNANQSAVANALINSFNIAGGIPMAFGSLSPAGLTLVSGELGTATQQATIDQMNLFLGIMTDPFVSGRGEAVPPSTSPDEALGYAARRPRSGALAAIYRKAPPAPVVGFSERWSVWSGGFGGSATTSGNAVTGSNNATARVAGGVVGLDYRISPATLAGIALAGGGTSFSVAGGGSGQSDVFQAGGFVRHHVGATYLTAALAYGWQDVITSRNVGADRLTARFTTDAFSGRVEAGHRVAAPLGVGLTPYAAGQSTTISLPNYAETGGALNTFGLAYAARDVTSSRSELGFRTDKSFGVGGGLVTLRGRAAWAHNFDPGRAIGASFLSLPASGFIVNGAAQARDAALVTASAEMNWRNGWSAAATFEGECSHVTTSYAGKGLVRKSW